MRPNWEHFGSKKSDSRELFSTFRPAASRGAHGPHPAIPKAPQRSPKASTRAIFGALWLKKGGPNASKAVHGWHVEPIFGQDCERMSGGGHFWSNLDIFLFFKVFLWHFLLEFQGKIKSGLKGSDFFSFQFFFLSLPFCFFPVGGRGDFRVGGKEGLKPLRVWARILGQASEAQNSRPWKFGTWQNPTET